MFQDESGHDGNTLAKLRPTHVVWPPTGTRQNTAFSPHFSLLLGA
jgi:hypothetical protein